MKDRLRRAFKIYGTTLPWVLLKKLIATCVKAETVIVYSHAFQQRIAEAHVISTIVEVVRIADRTTVHFKSLCAKFPQIDFIKRLQQAGRECYVALRDGKICGYAWVANNNLQIDEIAHEYPLTKQEIFIYDCFVDTECRGTGIYPAMLNAILEDHRVRRIELSRALIASSSINRASIRGIKKAGFLEFKRIHYVQWRSYQRWWEKPA